VEDLTGRQLGSYQIIGPLGEGGMAAVYKAFQPSMDRVIALKVLPRHYASDPEFTGRFHREARVIANLQHPHILPVFDFGQSDGYTYLAMPFIEGGTLTDLLRQRRLSLAEIQRIVNQVGDALDYAHAQGLVHRDIKPSNILLDRRNNCLLADFGLARLVEGAGTLTQSGAMVGTPAYMSPEQGLGEKVDSRSDIYALGVILYQMVAGRPPFQAETPMAVMIKHIHDPLLPPRHYNPAVPEAVERVILKALSKSPADRYATAGDLVRAFNQAIDASAANPQLDQTAVAPRLEPTLVAPPPRKIITGGLLLLGGLGALAGLALVLLLIALVIRSSLANDDEETAATPPLPGVFEPALEPLPTAANDPSTAWDELIDQANVAYDSEEMEQALALYDQAIELEPERPQAYCYRGNLWRDMEEYEAAAADYDQCAALAAASGAAELEQEGLVKAAKARAYRALEEGDYEAAASHFSTQAELEPTNPEPLCELGNLYLYELDDRDRSIAYFDHCLELAGDSDTERWATSGLLAAQAVADREAGDYEAAIASYAEFAELNPNDPDPHCEIGDLYNWDLEQWPAAITAYERCLELATEEETQNWGGYGLANAQASQARAGGEWETAVLAYSQAINIRPDAWLYCSRGELYLEMGDADAARQDFETCLELGGDDPDVQAWAEALLQSLDE
jgi:tetratricopeptide (TPR) repeat protein